MDSTFWLDDALWRAIMPVLPARQSGPKRNDDRTIISGIVHVLISECAWRDCPRVYGSYMTVFNRFNRWKHRGLWDRIVAILVDPEKSSLSAEEKQRVQAASARAESPAGSRGIALPLLSSEQAWDEATAQLRKLAQNHHGRPIAAWIDAVVEWHMDALFEYLEKVTPAERPVEWQGDVEALRQSLLSTIALVRAYIEEPGRNTAAIRQRLAQLENGLRLGPTAGVRKRAS
jgi:transposase